MSGTPVHPCPRCGYDQSGAIAVWSDRWPLKALCPECGIASPTGALFSLGPAWSFEHARRRLVWCWLRTTLIALLPGRLWSELRPEHPIVRRRLAWLAIGWLALMNVAGASAAAGSAVWLMLYGSMGAPAWNPSYLSRWSFWGHILGGLAWPYRFWIEVPMNLSTSATDPLSEFALMAALPHLAMAAVLLFTFRPLRTGFVPRRHLARALVYTMPNAVLWMVIVVLTFVAAMLAQRSPVLAWAGTFLALGKLAAYMGTLIWWWTRFVTDYLGYPVRRWTMLGRGLAALVLAWVGVYVVNLLVGLAR